MDESPLRFREVWCSILGVVRVMAPCGILLVLYALASWVWPLMGQQLVLFLWMQRLPLWGQWSVRVGLVALGLTLLGLAWRRRGS